jgi:hypothetical protein
MREWIASIDRDGEAMVTLFIGGVPKRVVHLGVGIIEMAEYEATHLNSLMRDEPVDDCCGCCSPADAERRFACGE